MIKSLRFDDGTARGRGQELIYTSYNNIESTVRLQNDYGDSYGLDMAKKIAIARPPFSGIDFEHFVPLRRVEC